MEATSNICITYCSDIHLEYTRNGKIPKHFIPTPPPPSSNDEGQIKILILAGDIGHVTKSIYTLYLKKCRLIYDHVLVIAGNHEYWAKRKKGRDQRISMEEIDEQLHIVCKEAGCIFLQKHAIKIKDYWFLGCTMWTDVPEEGRADVGNFMNDYLNIFFKDPYTNILKRLTTDQIHLIHQDHKRWLSMKLDWIRNLDSKEKVIVVTHHQPSIDILNSSAFRMYGKYIKHAYGSTNLIKELATRSLLNSVYAWVCGHHHDHNSRKYSIPYDLVALADEKMKEEEEEEEEKGILTIYVNCIGYTGQRTLSFRSSYSASYIII